MEIYLPLDDLINLDEERARLAKEVGKIEDELARVQKKLANGDFLAKAKTEVMHKGTGKGDPVRGENSHAEKQPGEDSGNPGGKELSRWISMLARR